MITTDDVLATLNAMGFATEDMGEMGYLFHYNHTRLLLMPDEDDEKFLRFAAPALYEVNDDNRAAVMEVVNKVNLHMKYSKMCVWHDDVWNFYEYRLFGNDIDLEDMVELVIRVLSAGSKEFFKAINGENDIPEQEDDMSEE